MSMSAAASEESRRDDRLSIAVLFVLLLLAFGDVLFAGRALFARDIYAFHFPGRATLRQIVTAGEFPSWNPAIGAGQPLAANPNNQAFYPPHLLILLPDYLTGFQLYLVLHFLILALGGWTLTRVLGAGPWAALVTALSLSLGGLALSAAALVPILLSLAWHPWILAFSIRAFQRRSTRDVVLAIACFGMSALIGEPTSMIQISALVGVVAIREGWRDRAGGWRRLVPVMLALTIGIGGALAAAIQLLPTLELTGDSVRTEGFPKQLAETWSMPAFRALEPFAPNLAGSYVDNGAYYWSANHYPGKRSPFFYSIYPGLLMSLLAVAFLVSYPKRSILVAGLVLLFFAIATGRNGPLFAPLYELGLFRITRYPERLAAGAVVILTVAGGLSFQRWADGDRRIGRALAILAGVVMLVSAVALLTSSLWFERAWRLGPTHPVDDLLERSRESWLWLIVRAGGVLGVAWIALRGRLRAAAGAGILLVALDLASIHHQVAPRVEKTAFSEPPIASSLPTPRDAYRIFHEARWRASGRAQWSPPGFQSYLVARNAMLPRLPQAWGFRTVLDADLDETYLAHTGSMVALMQVAAEEDIPGWREAVMEMNAASFWTRYRDFDSEMTRAGGRLADARPVQFVGMRFAPRYRFARRLLQAQTPQEVLAALRAGEWTSGTAFIEEEPFEPAPARIVSVDERSNSVRIEVEAEGTAWLVASNTDDEEWRATLDGVPEPIRRTDVAFQGIRVPAGSHVIELRYENPLFAVGGAISIATILMLVALWIRNPSLPGTSSETPLHQNRVPPHAVEHPDPLPPTHEAESHRLLQTDAAGVLGKRGRLQRPDPLAAG